MTESIDPADLTTIEAIRKRPRIYVGDGLFGLINYLVYPFVQLFSQGIRWIDVSVKETGFEIRSDAITITKRRDDGRIIPFEAWKSSDEVYGFEFSLLNALSETLVVRAAHSGSLHTLTYRQGERVSYTTCEEAGSFTELSFAPDPSIFNHTSLSPAIFESYLRRMSYLHRGIRFRLAYADQTREYYAPGGLRDLFDSLSAPYQLMNTPIYIETSEGRLRLELVFAYHSWTEDWRWCFINNGRAVEGGTHEQGLKDAFDQIHDKLKIRPSSKRGRNGIVALMSIIYPDVVWGGCIKARIGSPELPEIVSRLVVTNVLSWIDSHPEAAEELKQLQIFQFPDAWYS